MAAMRFTLFHKGLAVVSVLVACEFAFVGAMAYLLHEADVEAARLAHAKEIVDNTNALLDDLNYLNQVFGNSGLNTDTLETPEFVAAQENVPAQIDKLRVLVQDKPAQLERLKSVHSNLNRARDVLLGVKRMLADNPSPAFMFGPMMKALEELRFLRDITYQELLDLTKEERDIESKSPAAQEAVRKQQHGLLFGGLMLNAALAFILTIWLARGITSRLTVILGNTLRLAKHQPLMPRLGGTDEISQLDRVFHDVAEALLEAERKEAELSQLKREFVAMASHELRTPLTSVLGTLTLANEGMFGPLSPALKDKLTECESNVDRLIKLINDVLDIEKMQSGKIAMTARPTKAQSLIESAQIAVNQFATTCGVAVVCDSTDVTLDVDPDRITQVFVNLLSNAIKFSPPGSEVRVEIDRTAEALEFRFIDCGPGIPQEYQQIIFDRFQQLDDQGQQSKRGTGLGLAISKAIVEQHHGSISVESEPGRGSCFTVKLPMAAQPSEQLMQPCR